MTKAITAAALVLLIGACSAADLLSPGDAGYEACEFVIDGPTEISRDDIERCATITIRTKHHDEPRPR